MDVATYLKISKKTQADLARDLGTTRGHVWSLLNGHRKPGKKFAARLENATGIGWKEWLQQ